MIERTELLYERAQLRTDGEQKHRTRVLAGMPGPERRDLYSRLERRFRDAIRTVRKAMPARAERRTKSLQKRYRSQPRFRPFQGARHPGFKPLQAALGGVNPPTRFRGGIGIVRNR